MGHSIAVRPLIAFGLILWLPFAVADAVFDNGFEAAQPAAGQVVITPGFRLLVSQSESASLTAQPLDQEGNVVTAPVSWRSKDPASVTVTEDGVITALAPVGSAQIIAEAEGFLPGTATVVIASPVAGAVLIADSQVQGMPAPATQKSANPFGLGYQYTVVLNVNSAPEAGDILVATGEMPVGGRVISAVTDGDLVTVTLEVVPLPDMFAELVVREKFDLSRAPIDIRADLIDSYSSTRFDDGSIVFSSKLPSAKGGVALTQVTQFVDCSESTVTNPTELINLSTGADLSFDPNLTVDLDYDSSSGDFSLEVGGGVMTSLDLRPRTTAAFEGKISCKFELARIPLPLAGVLSYIFSPLFPIGAGVEVNGKVSLTEPVGFDLTAVGGYQAELGLICEPDCGLQGELDVSFGGTAQPVLPPSLANANDVQLELSGLLFAYADLDFGNPLLRQLSFSTFGAKAGVMQSGNFRGVESQVNDTNYASEFKLEATATLGPSNDLASFLATLQLTPPLDQQFAVTTPLAQSPRGTLVITDPNGGSSATPGNPATVRAGNDSELGEQATFTVTLSNTQYVGAYIVEGVELYELKSNGVGGFTLEPGRPGCSSVSATENQTVFTCQTDFVETGTRTFYAFVRASLFGVSLPFQLEVGNNSAAVVTVTDDQDPVTGVSKTAVAQVDGLVEHNVCNAASEREEVSDFDFCADPDNCDVGAIGMLTSELNGFSSEIDARGTGFSSFTVSADGPIYLQASAGGSGSSSVSASGGVPGAQCSDGNIAQVSVGTEATGSGSARVVFTVTRRLQLDFSASVEAQSGARSEVAVCHFVESEPLEDCLLRGVLDPDAGTSAPTSISVVLDPGQYIVAGGSVAELTTCSPSPEPGTCSSRESSASTSFGFTLSEPDMPVSIVK